MFDFHPQENHSICANAQIGLTNSETGQMENLMNGEQAGQPL
jgi:hypothetical protein